MTISTDPDQAKIPFNPADAVAADDFADDPAPATSASAEASTESAAPAMPASTSSSERIESALRDLVPAPRRERDEDEDDAPEPKGDDDARPYINGANLLSALKYVLVACPKPSEDDSQLSYVVIERDVALGRVSLTACDTNRWHQAFVACPTGINLRGVSRISKNDAMQLRDFLQTAVDRGAFCNVRPQSNGIGVTAWEIAFGGGSPLVIDASPSFAHEGWKPPPFAFDNRAGIAAQHDARHVAKAMTVPGAESTRVVRDSVDSAGRRHVTITDEFGHELARAVLVQLGFSEGEPISPQTEIPGTIGTPDRVRSAPPKPAKKVAKAKAKPASKPAKSAPKKAAAKPAKAKAKKRR